MSSLSSQMRDDISRANDVLSTPRKWKVSSYKNFFERFPKRINGWNQNASAAIQLFRLQHGSWSEFLPQKGLD